MWLDKVVATFKFLYETLVCDHSNEEMKAVEQFSHMVLTIAPNKRKLRFECRMFFFLHFWHHRSRNLFFRFGLAWLKVYRNGNIASKH